MSLDLSVLELSLLSDILIDFSERHNRFQFLSDNDYEILCNLINKVDNELSV